MKKHVFLIVLVGLSLLLTGCEKKENPYKQALEMMNATLQKMMEINQSLMEALIRQGNQTNNASSTTVVVVPASSTADVGTDTNTGTDTGTDIGTASDTASDSSGDGDTVADTASDDAVSDDSNATGDDSDITPDAVSPNTIPGTIRNYSFEGTDGDGKPFQGTVTEEEKQLGQEEDMED